MNDPGPDGPPQRLDRLLVRRGLCSSRARAHALISAGHVVVGDTCVDRPGARVSPDADIRLRVEDHPFVSRGGLKLQGALDAFDLDVSGRRAMDVGASTGGFTDCLLRRGVREVHAVDVGRGQLVPALASDPRVHAYDRTNIRDLEPARLGVRVDLVVVDCSFISLTKVLPHLPRHLTGPADGPVPAPADVVVLVKPQFELGPGAVGKGGIVRDVAAHRAAVQSVEAAARAAWMEVAGRCDSPISGGDGNLEFFLWLRVPVPARSGTA